MVPPLRRLARGGTAREVPGTTALNRGGQAGTGAVSCASAGDCGAGAFCTDSPSNPLVVVASEAKLALPLG